jgi:HEPN domain-containing protein
MKGLSEPIPWDEVEAWLTIAERDRRSVLLCLAADPPLPEIAAFHCQQAVEKLLKGFLVLAGVEFRRTHELAELGTAAAEQFPEIAPLVAIAESWTVWGVAYRYPSAEGPLETGPDRDELRQALRTIEELTDRLRCKRPPDPPRRG